MKSLFLALPSTCPNGTADASACLQLAFNLPSTLGALACLQPALKAPPMPWHAFSLPWRCRRCLQPALKVPPMPSACLQLALKAGSASCPPSPASPLPSISLSAFTFLCNAFIYLPILPGQAVGFINNNSEWSHISFSSFYYPVPYAYGGMLKKIKKYAYAVISLK